MNLEGSVIENRYKIIEKIGTGGMATVYKALDQVLNRNVAVKVLRDEFTTDDEFIKRFNAEAQAAARLIHPNIVSVYDVGHEYNIYYIVMELIQGKTLKEIIDEDGCLPWKWSINVAIQIASALEMAHKNNIIHRDIKPHNIMITEDGVAKVTDFGIAKAVSNSTITAFGTTLGSVHYFSPEHARGGYTDAKSDLYSLGVVMYEMLTGKVPFDADTPVSIALKHMQEEVVEPRELNEKIPEAANKIIIKALKKNPNERYRNATEMIEDLKLALKYPSGDFVKENNIGDGLTRKISTLNDEEINFEGEEKEKSNFFTAHPKARYAVIAGVGVLIFVITLIITLAIMNASSPKNIQIPNVVGLSKEEAKKKIESSKLQYGVLREEYSSDVEEGFVISQSPAVDEYSSIKEGSLISVVVSKGIKTVKVPNVLGLEYSKAEELLKSSELGVEKIEETSQKVESGHVISQETVENTEVAVGTTIKVHVSTGTGIKQVEVTSVIGKSKDDAKAELTNLKLEVSVVEEEDTSKSNGVVLKQSITAGTKVDEGSKIVLTVNKIQENKNGTVNIHVKSLINKLVKQGNMDNINESTSDASSSSTVKLMVKVGSDTVFDKSVASNTENLSLDVSGKGNTTIKVYINGIRAAESSLDFNSSNTILTIE